MNPTFPFTPRGTPVRRVGSDVQWTRPHLAIPVHGENIHMRANARLASEQGVPHQLVGQNGDLFDLKAKKKQEAAVKVGRLWLNESSLSLEPVTQG